MPIVPRDFLDTANRLFAVGVHEADYRSSVSRAYYAAFSLVKAKTASFVSYSGAEEHLEARRQVAWRWHDLSDDFSSLQTARVESDYKLDRRVSRARAEHWLNVSSSLVSELERR